MGSESILVKVFLCFVYIQNILQRGVIFDVSHRRLVGRLVMWRKGAPAIFAPLG